MIHIFLALSLFAYSGCKSYEEVASNLTLQEASIILLALKQNSIEAKKIANKELKQTSFAVSVPKEYLTNSLKILLENNLPRQTRVSFKDLYTSSSNIIPSKTEEEAKFSLAMQGEVESLLKILPYVLDVKVVISTEVINDFSNSHKKNKASVVILTNCLNNDCLTKDEVQNIVASCIANLSPLDVNVTTKTSQPLDFASNNAPAQISNNNSNFIIALFFICFLFMFITCFLIYKTPELWLGFRKNYGKI